jgi:hypothetical protein
MESINLKRQPVVIVFSILAGLQVINGGLTLIDAVPKDLAGIFSLVLGAVTATASFYVRGMVTPWAEVISKLQHGVAVPGPAAGAVHEPPADPPVPPAAPPMNP